MCYSVHVCVCSQLSGSGQGCQEGQPNISALRSLSTLAVGATTGREDGRRSLGWKPGRGLQEARGVCLGLLTRIIAHVSIDCQASDVESLNDVAVPLLSVFNVM